MRGDIYSYLLCPPRGSERKPPRGLSSSRATLSSGKAALVVKSLMQFAFSLQNLNPLPCMHPIAGWAVVAATDREECSFLAPEDGIEKKLSV